MSEFLLLGARPPGGGETSPRRAAHDVAALTVWHEQLRRWGLLRAFAVPPDSATGLRACLVIRASGHAAADRLAGEWERRSGYRVTVLRLSTAAPGRDRR
ncbi:MAG TPA: hypothetical protein VEM58_10485 [Streptosporangiaceae bacterium]|nr:hypothetical protein [Streptosporangiaceae bacterium]